MSDSSTLRIDETLPLVVAQSQVKGIAIVPGAVGVKRKPNLAGIEAVLSTLPEESIEYFLVDYDSALRRLPDLSRFPNLRDLRVDGRKIQRLEDLSSLTRLEHLRLVNPKLTMLSDLNARHLETLQIIRGRLEVLDASASWVLLQSCSKLREIQSTGIRTLILEACRAVDLDCLAGVPDLESLHLVGHSELLDLDFLSRCSRLESLVISATKIPRARHEGLGLCQALKRVFLPIQERALREVAASYPSILFGNGDVSFRGGDRLDGAAYYDALEGQ
jgi:Leucine-rich repeat (LRR) protein